MNNEEQNYQIDAGERLGAGIMGIFLMSFGMPFTLIPIMTIPGAISSGSTLITVFLICFSIPFLLAGIALQYAGIVYAWMALFPKSKKALKTFQKIGFQREISNEKEISVYWSSDSSMERINEEIPAETVSTRPQKTADQTTNFWDNVEDRKA
tara:strand:- start:475 stop:933 length:459 start_codon:yes stop_codon:yes gene_type:complete